MTSPSQYAAQLRDLSSGRVYRLELNRRFLIGRSPSADLPLRDVSCSRQQFAIVVEPDGSCTLEPLSSTCPTFCDGRPVQSPTPLVHDVQIRAGQSEFVLLLRGESNAALPLAQIPTLPGGAGSPPEPGQLAPLRIETEAIIGRDPSKVQVCLPHVQVSRVHARIRRHGSGAIVVDLNSSNGTFVNGKRLLLPTRIEQGDSIGIGPFQLQLVGDQLVPTTRQNNLQLVARNLSRTVTDRFTGQSLEILDDVSLVVRPHEFVCLLGPAGCGKSTLLSALSARRPADRGAVLLNQMDLYASFESLKQDLVVVPQRDLLHRALSVEQALRFTAQLRLPRDTGTAEIDRVVYEVLETVGLVEQRQRRIAHLSGGQTKRTILAAEILGSPSLLFLDEVTSGLDEQSDRDMMRLFRRLADNGKTVVCVTHNLANVEETCHLIVMLAEGGRLAFIGTPREALSFFDVPRLGDIYERLQTRSPAQWKQAFRDSPYYARYVISRLASEPVQHRPTPTVERARLQEPLGRLWRQWPVLTARYLKLLAADRGALLAMACQCLLVALLSILVFGDVRDTGTSDPVLSAGLEATASGSLLFMTAVSCLWFGCNNSSKEIVKERAIFLKERQVNLNPAAYYASKCLPLAVLSVVQAAVLYLLIARFCQLPAAGLSQCAVMCGMALVGVTLGLFLSAIASSEEVAVALVPLVLIPQIIVSDLFVALEGIPEWIARVAVSSYWSYGALRDTLPPQLAGYLSAPPIARWQAGLMLGLHAIALAALALVALDLSTRGRVTNRLKREK